MKMMILFNQNQKQFVDFMVHLRLTFIILTLDPKGP